MKNGIELEDLCPLCGGELPQGNGGILPAHSGAGVEHYARSLKPSHSQPLRNPRTMLIALHRHAPQIHPRRRRVLMPKRILRLDDAAGQSPRQARIRVPILVQLDADPAG